MSRRYDKELIELEAVQSVASGRISETIGQFILDRAEEVSAGVFKPQSYELHRVLVDAAVMRCCEEFLDRYEEGKSAANLIISMVHSSMLNRLKATHWKDIYGELNKSPIRVVTLDGEIKTELIQQQRDENISRLISGENVNNLL
jgi:hypothetical protein|tara:strand:+ start:285 stop:719 length:435 start_codon:yes stop_codon:yes gene_type:complete